MSVQPEAGQHEERGSGEREELSGALGVFASDRYRAVRTLKETEWETTELVQLQVEEDDSKDDAGGLFVRKFIKLADGQTSAYETVYEAQVRNGRSIHLPHIVECARLGNDLAVVMEHVEGATLEQVVASSTDREELVSRLFPDICDAVTELHGLTEQPVIHRDIKPSNIVVVGYGADDRSERQDARVVLIDLGIARAFREGAAGDTVRFGTPGYAPPEQFGYGQTSVASDVYALGMLLYFCLTGDEPSAALRDEDVPFEKAPEAYRPVLMRATALDPKERFASAAKLKGALASAAHKTRPGDAAGKGEDEPRPAAAASKRLHVLGLIWNGLLLAAVLVFSIAGIGMAVDPPESMAARPFVPLLVCNLLMSPVFLGSLAYAASYRPPLRRRFRLCGRLSLKKELLVCALIAAAALILHNVVSSAAGF